LTTGLLARWNNELQLMEQLLQPLGHLTRRLSPSITSDTQVEQLDAVLLMADSCDAWLEQCVAAARSANRSSLKIVVLGFPRRHEVIRLRQLGGRSLRVVSKPFRIPQIQHHLQAFAAKRHPDRRRP
jgi:hypothetical protein